MTRIERSAFGFLCIGFLWMCESRACIPDAQPQDSPAVRRAVALITPDEVRRHVYVLADDSMSGRWTPSSQLEIAAQYLAGELRRTGLRPGGDNGSFLQHIHLPIDQPQILADSSAMWTSGVTAMHWRYGHDYIFPYNWNWTNWTSEGNAVLLIGSLDGRVTFDTTSLRGRILLLPGKGGVGGGGWRGRYEPRVANWHPAVIIYLDDVDSVLGEMAIRQLRRSQPARLVKAPGFFGYQEFPTLLMSYRAAAPLITLGGINLAEVRRGLSDTALRAIPLGDVVVHVRERVRLIPFEDPSNVVAILDGNDPVLRNEYVVYSAHYDHLGTGRILKADSIYNGADDNASGTAAVLAVAKAFEDLQVRPKRSIIFALVSAEELMGWGSSFFVEHPPIPVSVIVANINADMLGRNWRDSVVVLGRHDSDLGQAVDHVTFLHHELGLAVIDSSNRPHDAGEEELYSWSDHHAFIQKGIPFLYFYSGIHDDYHRPSDSADKINYEKLSRISRLMFYVGLEVANAEKRPQWDPDRFKILVPSR